MVAPLTVGGGAVINNFVYHQGEADVHGWYDPGGGGGNITSERVYEWYSCRLRALIADFRGTMGNLPSPWFGVSQLNPYAGDCGASTSGCSHVAAVRRAQLDVAQSTPFATAGVIPDLGDPLAPAGSVHSRLKAGLASRLVAGALQVKYGSSSKGGAFYGPIYAGARDVSSGSALAASVSFAPASLGGGLKLVLDVPYMSWCPVNASATAPSLGECGGFELLGAQSGWVNASSVSINADGASVTLSASSRKGSEAVIATRAYWNSYPLATLFSKNGLPAVPWNATL